MSWVFPSSCAWRRKTCNCSFSPVHLWFWKPISWGQCGGFEGRRLPVELDTGWTCQDESRCIACRVVQSHEEPSIWAWSLCSSWMRGITEFPPASHTTYCSPRRNSAIAPHTSYGHPWEVSPPLFPWASLGQLFRWGGPWYVCTHCTGSQRAFPWESWVNPQWKD